MAGVLTDPSEIQADEIYRIIPAENQAGGGETGICTAVLSSSGIIRTGSGTYVASYDRLEPVVAPELTS